LWLDDRDHALTAELRAKAIGIISAIGDATFHAEGRADKRVGALG